MEVEGLGLVNKELVRFTSMEMQGEPGVAGHYIPREHWEQRHIADRSRKESRFGLGPGYSWGSRQLDW